jgi:hypothetical protein
MIIRLTHRAYYVELRVPPVSTLCGHAALDTPISTNLHIASLVENTYFGIPISKLELTDQGHPACRHTGGF